MQGTDQLAELADDGQPLRHHPGPDHRQLLIPEGELLLPRLLVTDGTQQGIALGEHASELGQVAHGGPVALRHDGVKESAPLGGRSHQQQHLLRSKQDAAHRLPQPAHTPWQAIEGDALADLPGRIHAGDERLDAQLRSTLVD